MKKEELTAGEYLLKFKQPSRIGSGGKSPEIFHRVGYWDEQSKTFTVSGLSPTHVFLDTILEEDDDLEFLDIVSRIEES